MSVAEKQVALRLAALHPADQAWILARVDTSAAARIRTWLRDGLVKAAARLRIGPSDVAPAEPMVEAFSPAMASDAYAAHEPLSAHPAWASLLADPHGLPPALAASVSRYRAQHASTLESVS